MSEEYSGCDQCDRARAMAVEEPSTDAAVRRMLDRLPVDVRPDVLKVIKAVQSEAHAAGELRT